MTFDTIGSSFDTLLAVYTGTAVNALTTVASNDDIDTSGHNYQSRVTFTAVAWPASASSIALSTTS